MRENNCREIFEVYDNLIKSRAFFVNNLSFLRTDSGRRKEVLSSKEKNKKNLEELWRKLLGYHNNNLLEGKMDLKNLSELYRLLLTSGHVIFLPDRTDSRVPAGVQAYFEGLRHSDIQKILKERRWTVENKNSWTTVMYFYKEFPDEPPFFRWYDRPEIKKSERSIGAFIYSSFPVADDEDLSLIVFAKVYLVGYFDTRKPPKMLVFLSKYNTNAEQIPENWQCDKCRGNGCWDCNYTGGNY